MARRAEAPQSFEAKLGSFSEWRKMDEEFDAMYAKLNIPLSPERRNSPIFR